MQNVKGSFSGRANWQTVIPQDDLQNHEIGIVEIAGLQKSSDAHWNDARVTYWGLGETISGNGTQKGHFINRHTDGSTDRGTFECQIVTTGKNTILEGTYTITGGTARFNGVTGNGTFHTRVVSPTQVETNWEGTYELVEAKHGAGR
jgi:hypothetical protein